VENRSNTWLPAAIFLTAAATSSGAEAQQEATSPARIAAFAVPTEIARTGPPVLDAVSLLGSEPEIDGRIDEAAWERAAVASDFVQLEPREGDPASEATEVRVLYGAEALFVAFRAFDSEPHRIEGQLTRRDQESFSDRVHVLIDSYYDHRTAFHFAVNPRGVKQDYYRFNDTQEDVGWDAVWDVATAIDEEGWTAEFKIPYSQLRFAGGEDQTWGINFLRDIARRNESSFWAPISGEDNALVSRFGELRGLRGIERPTRVEVMPYTLGRLRRAPGDDADPFYQRNEQFGTAGLDLKYGLTSNLTLDVSVNPDFGQVEADPAQVNLSAFETFLPERRPFFIEGASIFSFPVALGDGDGANESLFYSRRIGRPPQGWADPRGGYVDKEENTTIQVASKLSGKTESGWSIGLLHASTARERANVITGSGEALQPAIEPSTQYGVVRLQKDFREGRSAVGVIGTGTLRDDEDARALNLHSSAFAGGMDFRHRFAGGNYQVSGYALGSRVEGSPEAIARTQQAPGRYLQRPDADHLAFDPTRTSLSGMTAFGSIGKIGGGFWRFSTGFQTRTPEFEVNDMGFLMNVDYLVNWAWVGYNHYLPSKHFRRWNINANAWRSQSYGGEVNGLGGNLNGQFQLSNYWTGMVGVNQEASVTARTLLRGGPSIKTEPRTNFWGGFGSDGRKPVRVNVNFFGNRTPASDSWSFSASPNVTWRPSGRARVSVGGFYNRRVDDRQWVGQVSLEEEHYLFGRIDQQTLGITSRVDVAFTPTLSLQLYAQPFVSAAGYERFKQVADPMAPRYADRYDLLDTTPIEGGYEADLDGDGTAEFVRDPDFNFKQFRSNAVLRWEYRPGSTLFLVWSQGRNHYAPEGDFQFASDLGTLFDAPTDNVFMVKMSYWLNP
jgi:hypothetical protein